MRVRVRVTTSVIEGEILTQSGKPRDLGLNVTLKTYFQRGQSDMRDSRAMRPNIEGRDGKKGQQVASTRGETEMVCLISGKREIEIHY